MTTTVDRRIARRRPLYIFCLDFGQTQDPSARAVLERVGRAPAVYAVRDLRRYDLGTPYQTIADDTALRWSSPEVVLSERHLVVDATGVGRPVTEMLVQHGLEPVMVIITGGHDVTVVKGPAGLEYRVPKRDLAMAMQLVLQAGRFKVAPALPHAATLKAEFQNFRVKLTKTGHDVYEAWREGDHDDLLLAIATGVWWAENVYLDDPDDDDETDQPEAQLLGDPERM